MTCVIGGAGFVALAGRTANGSDASRPEVVVDAPGARMLPAGAKLLVRAVDHEDEELDGRLFETGLEPGATPTAVGDLACERVHANAGGDGICLAVARNGFDYVAVLFRRDFEPRARFSIPGVPDRARVSADGRYGAYTTFLAGHTYSHGVRQFATHTAIIDMRAREPLFSLDELAITRHGERFEHADANLWGVTFASGDRFYATLGTAGRQYLIEGRIDTRRAHVVREHVECPSLSPDGRRIAYKWRIGKQDLWRLHVLDLDSGRDVALAERRSIDDQPEWLGDDTVVYSDDRAVFSVPADGSGHEQRLVERASSPVGLP